MEKCSRLKKMFLSLHLGATVFILKPKIKLQLFTVENRAQMVRYRAGWEKTMVHEDILDF